MVIDVIELTTVEAWRWKIIRQRDSHGVHSARRERDVS